MNNNLRGFFLLFPDDTSCQLLRNTYPNIANDMHLTILVITNEEEIKALETRLGNKQEPIFNFQEVQFQAICQKSLLNKRDGTSIAVLHIPDHLCVILKRNLIDYYNVSSDEYGDKQKFHITLGPSLIFTDDAKVNVLNLRFDKLLFSVMDSNLQNK